MGCEVAGRKLPARQFSSSCNVHRQCHVHQQCPDNQSGNCYPQNCFYHRRLNLPQTMPFMYHEEYSAYSQEEERISEAWMRASRCRGGFEIETTMGEIRS
ncbi:hypothetical protein ACN38_g1931 [Penicillium nordicum]|uniref:Uncharacterized protein n=1 Tax=Penicillium nordicum TaxID=229535 RepID=A0A0M8PGD8_9EURO|nr:hypothetical protein ACN38_g1931 [Penicillium nordicum]